jgi:hypothetical protein
MSRLLNARGTCPPGDEDIWYACHIEGGVTVGPFNDAQYEYYRKHRSLEGYVEESSSDGFGSDDGADDGSSEGENCGDEAYDPELVQMLVGGMRVLKLGGYWNAFTSRDSSLTGCDRASRRRANPVKKDTQE